MRKQLSKFLTLFVAGGSIYFLIELIFKLLFTGGVIHWSMFLLGGFCFVIIGGLNNYISWEIDLIGQGLIGAVIITTLEFVFGCILNLWLDLGIWNYSHLPFNILGQICLPFSIAWFFLAIIAILLDDFLRYKWFNEEKPHYHIFYWQLCRK